VCLGLHRGQPGAPGRRHNMAGEHLTLLDQVEGAGWVAVVGGHDAVHGQRPGANVWALGFSGGLERHREVRLGSGLLLEVEGQVAGKAGEHAGHDDQPAPMGDWKRALQEPAHVAVMGGNRVEQGRWRRARVASGEVGDRQFDRLQRSRADRGQLQGSG
jgi:hypothetical protein